MVKAKPKPRVVLSFSEIISTLPLAPDQRQSIKKRGAAKPRTQTLYKDPTPRPDPGALETICLHEEGLTSACRSETGSPTRYVFPTVILSGTAWIGPYSVWRFANPDLEEKGADWGAEARKLDYSPGSEWCPVCRGRRLPLGWYCLRCDNSRLLILEKEGQ